MNENKISGQYFLQKISQKYAFYNRIMKINCGPQIQNKSFQRNSTMKPKGKQKNSQILALNYDFFSQSECQRNRFQDKNPLKIIQSQEELNSEEELEGSYENELKREQPKVITQWTHEENIKYIAFLQVHRNEYENKRKFLLREFCEYATAGNYQKIHIRNDIYSVSDKTIKEYGDFLKSQYNVTEEEVKEEKQRLITFQAKRQKFYEEDEDYSPELHSIKEKCEWISLNPKSIKVSLRQYTQYFNFSDFKLRIIPCKKQQITRKGSLKKKHFMAEFEIKMSIDRSNFNSVEQGQSQNQAKSLQEQKNLSQNNACQKDQLNQKVLNDASDFYLFKWRSSNLFNTKKLLKIIEGGLDELTPKNEFPQIDPQNEYKSSEQISKQKKINKQRDRYQWTYIESIRFFLFLSIYNKKYSNKLPTTEEFNNFMAQFVKTRSRVKCYGHYKSFENKYQTLSELLDAQMTKHHISHEEMSKLVKQQIEKSSNIKELLFFNERIRRIFTQKKLSKLTKNDELTLIYKLLQKQVVVLKLENTEISNKMITDENLHSRTSNQKLERCFFLHEEQKAIQTQEKIRQIDSVRVKDEEIIIQEKEQKEEKIFIEQYDFIEQQNVDCTNKITQFAGESLNEQKSLQSESKDKLLERKQKKWTIIEEKKYVQCLKKWRGFFDQGTDISTHLYELMEQEMMLGYTVYKSAKQIKFYHKKMLLKFDNVDQIIHSLEKKIAKHQESSDQQFKQQKKYKYLPQNMLEIEFNDEEIQKLIHRIKDLGSEGQFTFKIHFPVEIIKK